MFSDSGWSLLVVVAFVLGIIVARSRKDLEMARQVPRYRRWWRRMQEARR